MHKVLGDLKKLFERMIANLKSEKSLLKKKFTAKDNFLSFCNWLSFEII